MPDLAEAHTAAVLSPDPASPQTCGCVTERDVLCDPKMPGRYGPQYGHELSPESGPEHERGCGREKSPLVSQVMSTTASPPNLRFLQ